MRVPGRARRAAGEGTSALSRRGTRSCPSLGLYDLGTEQGPRYAVRL